ncbi:MAG: PD-(D/E)XK nuclease domain-containing protein [candidate division KSB1 bacterium]|nr:PD-(D/E)XK nuclease domain-containing protein [candidate division KSB1 bacterium]MDZ7300462.1 PD-(D/E)XK nuclease domain-containing protein [candidate division KSB1 bacterium]MDZ7308640.1 PD-(D/E)XK nuclease domain-containing protein [candidate division KSB1 bacterium]MDZ7351436.1 PD-(D/E)XK nuclease domain-containing protein [candidate division KSB1 bacterium]MDZ7355795.1 PD-(D/E)XK nuclease domain-containing protein [candidate division KSB1 bacterium]
MRYSSQRPDDFDPAKTLCQLTVPNWEVRSIYINIVERWFAKRLENKKLEILLQAFLNGDVETFEELPAELVERSFSYWDATSRDAEKVYQAFTIGLLVWLSDRYQVRNNQESGYGRYDVMLIPREVSQAGIIIEFKKVNSRRGETRESAMAKAFEQIAGRKYAGEPRARGVQQIRQLAIVFEGKQVWVKEWTADESQSGGH